MTTEFMFSQHYTTSLMLVNIIDIYTWLFIICCMSIFFILVILQTFEEWEREKQEADMESYNWENNQSKKAYVAITQWPQKVSEDDVKSYSIENDTVGQKYKEAVTDLLNNGKIIDIYFKNCQPQ